MTDEQRTQLQNFATEWRKVAQRVGPLHAMWDSIIDAEAILSGRPSILSAETLLSMELPDGSRADGSDE